MTMLQHGLVPSTGGYQIERSLRFNSADSANLNRTWSTPTNAKIGTLSFWCKRSKLGDGSQVILQNSTNAIYCGFDNNNSGDDKFGVYLNNNTTKQVRVTTQVFRDASAWYHFVLAIDTANATAANRLKLYVNGVQVSDFSTSNTIDQNIDVFTADTYRIGSYAGSVEFLDGYLTEVNFIDGSTPTTTTRTVSGVTETILTQFGEFDTDTGVWKPKAYSGSYGTNGFYLKFADNSATTSTTLGKDSSGNGNNWTPNNFSVTAGVGNDSLVDTPTPYGTDTGAGGEVRGNYATLNPTIPPLTSQATTVISNGNLDFSVTQQNGTFGVAFSTIGVSSGKWYFEYLATNIRTATYVGFLNSANFAGYNGGSYGFTTPSDGYARIYSGYVVNNSSILVSGLSTFTDGDIVMCAVDFDAGKMWFGVNGTWDSSGNPGSGTNQTASFTPGGKTYVFAVQGYANTGVGVVNGTANFGQRPFAYTAPSGFKALCTTNLPTPTIGATATTRADDYFNTVLYTGTGSSQNITGVGFQPDFVWIKGRSGATDHGLYDAVRGVQKQIESNTTTDETTESTGLTAFNADGFTVGALAQLNTSSATYVAWNWKETATAGFDIVTYTGNGTARTISHNLGVAPNMIIVKARTTASTDQGWPVYHSANTAAPETDYLMLDTTAATADLDTVWNDTAPTSSVFSVGTNALVNANNDTYVAYLFSAVAGYSAFGSYTGNGSADGVFVYTGFRPRWIMIKLTSGSYDWILWDTARNTYNVSQSVMWPNLSSAEYTGSPVAIDILSNGFKFRDSSGAINGSGGTYIYAAFAEVPTKFALAR